MNMKIKELYKGLYHIKFDNQYECASTFCRPQEFYESPYESIKGCRFTLEEYMDRYAKEFGNFTYYTEWDGFNVTGESFMHFFDTIDDEYDDGYYLEKEKALWLLVTNTIRPDEKFYVIATHDDADIKHEFSHGLYYLNEEYKESMEQLVNASKYKEHVERKLLAAGYGTKHCVDEMQAYFACEDKKWLDDYFDLKKADGNYDVPFKIVLQNFLKDEGVKLNHGEIHKK